MNRTARIISGLVGAGIPIGYMIATHIRWEGDANGRMRMALKHIGFWGGLAATLVYVHRFSFRAKTLMKAMPGVLATSTFPIIGYEAFRRLAKVLYPSKPYKTSSETTLSKPSTITRQQFPLYSVTQPLPSSRPLYTPNQALSGTSPVAPFRYIPVKSPGMPI